MNTVKLDSRRKARYIGMNWRGVLPPLTIKPNDSLICCDLRDCSLDGLDLSMVEFFGCRLNGTSFRGATLRETKFIGCFSSHDAEPTDFRNSIWEDVSVVDSHLNYLSDPNILDSWKWPDEVAAAATETLSKRNDVRYEAATKLGNLDNPVVAPLLGCLLADKEWDVRSIALEILGNIRHNKFPHGDEALLEWIFMRLGDSHPIVQQSAVELVETLAPLDRVLLASIRRMMASSSEEKLAGLRAAIELCDLDDKYSHLLDRNTLKRLRSDEDPNISSLLEDLLYILDEQSPIHWLVTVFSNQNEKEPALAKKAKNLKTGEIRTEKISVIKTLYARRVNKFWKTSEFKPKPNRITSDCLACDRSPSSLTFLGKPLNSSQNVLLLPQLAS